ncbi:MAG TPA: SRPBCC domain-containing protein [Candidatus Dormibacteraeota bacterium]|nr:SRPBCC domain-containing protein [Candidatus Dormibacteraeota bacterium]
MEVEQRIEASPDTVFSYLIDPVKFVTWMGIGAELDPQPGGRFRIHADADNVAIGEYLVVDPPQRLVMTWGWERGTKAVPPGSTTVEITLTPDGSGTVLRLRHMGLPSGDAREHHHHGWILYTGNLVKQFA